MLKVIGRFWVLKNGKSFLGSGRAELLSRIESTGSINKAAKAMRMSYKAAWDAIDALNNLSATPLVHKVAGGGQSGGTTLSEEGKKAILTTTALESLKDRFFAEFDNCQSLDEILDKIKELEKKLDS